jgi:hypothetical protein
LFADRSEFSWGFASQFYVGNAERSARIIENDKDIYYPGAPHGLTATHQDQVNADLLTVLER